MAIRHRARTDGAFGGSLWLDATYLKLREGGRIISRVVTVAVAVNENTKREVLA